MATLNLYDKRRFNTIKLSDGIVYKIPDEYTVNEVERLLELKARQEEISSIEAGDTKEEKEKNLDLFWDNIMDQIEIIFKSFQPEIDKEYLSKIISNKQALDIVGFFQKYRALALGNIENDGTNSKKKLKN